MKFKFDKGMRILLFLYIAIASLNLGFEFSLEFRRTFNLTIVLGIGIFWIILEIIDLIKELKDVKVSER